MNVLMLLSKEILTDDRVYREARTLTEEGYKVTVITWDRFGEYKCREIIDGVEVIRMRSKSLMERMPNNLPRLLIWQKKAYDRSLELYRTGFEFDFVHCHDLDTLPVGVQLKKRLNIKLVYDAHEAFGYMIKDDHPVMSKLSLLLEKLLIKYVDHIVTVNDHLDHYLKRVSEGNKPITVVMNCKELINREYTPPKNKVFTLVYIGNLHKNRFFPQLIDVVGEIDGVELVIAAKKENKKLYDLVERRSKIYNNVNFLGTISCKEVLSLVRKGNAVVHIVNPLDIKNRLGLANKQFEAMVCGRPIITTKGTYAGELVEKLKCGLVIDYDPESVREAIIKLRDNPELCEELGRNALKAAIERYNWDLEKRKLLEVYERMMKT